MQSPDDKAPQEQPAWGGSPAQRSGGPAGALTPAQARAALEELRTLAGSAGEHSQELDRVSKALRENDYRTELTQVIQEALASPSPNPHVGALWIRRVVSSKGWDRSYPPELDAMCERGEIGREAVVEFLETAGRKRRGKLVLKALGRHGLWLAEHRRGWNTMARALANARCYRQCLRWTRDWRQRPGVEFQGLYARAAALHAMGKVHALVPVTDAALELPGSELEKSELRLWRALGHALEEKTAEAEADFRTLDPTGWGDDSLCLFYLVRGVIRVQQAPGPERAEAFEAAWRRILDRFRGTRVYLRSRSVRRDYRRCLWRMSMDAGRYGQGLQAWWRSADSWLPLPVLLMAPGLQLLLPVYLYRYARGRDRKRRSSPFDTL